MSASQAHWLHSFRDSRALLMTTLAIVGLMSGLAWSAEPMMPATRSAFINDEHWPDTDGQHINAHGGGILYRDGVYYWYGEARPRQKGDVSGVACYSSKDLYNWKNEGLVLAKVEDATSDIADGCIIERPKVVHNPKTNKFVMWFHLELRGQGYRAARTALAISDSPTGPFTYVRSLRPNAGTWPVEFPEDQRTPLDARPHRR